METDRHVKCTVNTSTLRTVFLILHVNDHKLGVKTCEVFDKFNVAQTCENYAQNLSTKFLIKSQLTARTKHVLYMHNIPSYMCRRPAAL